MKPNSTEVGVAWSVCQRTIKCEECTQLVMVGEPTATYEDRGLEGWGKLWRRKVRYCEHCGKLLEDSLTTTETD